MRTPLLALFFTAFVFFIFLRVTFCYDESPWQPVLYDYYHIDLGELGGNHDQGHGVPSPHILPSPHVAPTPDYGGLVSRVPVPRDTIVDVINDLGIKLLAIHNEHNENNIAISPYGAFSVLAALSEGLQGEAAHEILHTVRIPKDKHVIRVGLRDIHRHLKSYFIPEEGFLAGLTLNLNNVTLRSEYEDVLRFYGFDYASFNNALYPEPPTTRKPTEGTTLETGLSISEGTTLVSTQKTEITTTEILTRFGEPSSEKPPIDTTTESGSTTTLLATTESKEGTTTIPQQPSTTQAETTIETTPKPDVTSTTIQATTTSLEPTTTISPETTVKELLETDETSAGNRGTTTEKAGAISTTTEAPVLTTIPPITDNALTSTTPSESTTKVFERTTKLQETTIVTEITSTTTEATTEKVATTTISPATTLLPPGSTTTNVAATTVSPETKTASTEIATTAMETTVMSANIVRTTREVTIEPESQLTTVTPTKTTVTPQITKTTTEIATTSSTDNTVSTQTETISTIGSLEDTTLPINGTALQNDFVNNAPVNVPPQLEGQPQEDVETTTPFFFGTTPDFQDMANLPPNQNNFDFNYNYDANNAPPAYDDSMANTVMPNPPGGAEFNNNFKRSARSIVDYVIARFYDDHHQYASPPPQRPQYVPQEPLTFAVYGKYRESGVNFMKYDTVLPYFFVQNLNALALSFPLDSSKYYLLLLLPLQDNGVDQLICDVRLHGNLRYIIENLRLTHVIATIPSFMLKGYVTLTPALQRLGIRKIFEPRQADFSKMTDVTDIYVTNIEQAVTVTIRNYLDPSAQRYKNFRQYPPVYFKADHPFLYFVIDSELHVALMVGKVINPLNSRIR